MSSSYAARATASALGLEAVANASEVDPRVLSVRAGGVSAELDEGRDAMADEEVLRARRASAIANAP